MKRIPAAAAFFAAACVAHAADKPAIGPPASWVRPLPPPPAPAKGSEGAAAAVLQQDVQLRFDATGQAQYDASQIKVQSAAGLAALGTIAVNWSPATDALTVHRLRILRGAQTIDLLPKDGAFTVIRRESQLESAAMVDGVLTAVIQPEGLQVGDVLDMAYTLRREDPLLRGRADAMALMAPVVPIAHARTVASWPTTLKVAWKAADGMPAPVVTDRNGETTAVVDVLALQPQPTPDGAPARFRIGRQLMFSNYAAWAEVSALMAPLYADAARLPPGSPVAAQAKAIAARTADPAARASAALALVQDEVRYLALVQGELGLKPAAADLTWSRRYGDCKGKTVLLLALLKALGIEAEPALAASALGDGLDGRLPAASVFDHVLVRAHVGGRDYWLDGTRIGDRDLASISTPPFGFVLPVRAAGATLVHLTPEPAKAPLSRTAVRIDASKGIDKPAHFHVETTFRGDGATALKLQLANLAPDDLDRALKSYWRSQYDFVTPSNASATFDTKAGEERLVMDGEAKMDWSYGGYEVDGASIGWRFDPHRDPGPHADAPFAVAFPAYTEAEETILLPDRGRGFSIWGETVDKQLAGYALTRRATIEGGVAHLVSTTRALTPEISLSQAQGDAGPLTELSKSTVRVRPPVETADRESDYKALLETKPTGLNGFIARAGALIDDGRFTEALQDLDAAVSLDPSSAKAVACRGLARAWLGQSVAAKADLDRAETLDPSQVVIWRARGLLAEHANQMAAAIQAYTHALELVPNDAFARLHRGDVYLRLNDETRALGDADALLHAEPNNLDVHRLKARVYVHRKDFASVRRESEAIVANLPEPQRRETYMEALWRAGDKEGLRGAADEVIAAKPSARAYMLRATTRGADDRAAVYADVNAALALDPHDYGATVTLARMRLTDGDRAEALTYAKRALPLAADEPEALVTLAELQGRAGDRIAASAAFAKVRAKAGADADLLNSICYAQATADVDLQQALLECDASLKLRPGDAATLDSRAFVLLRLGRNEEALAAYDASLAAKSDEAASLYGRSLVERRLGDAAAAQRDLEAARQKDHGLEKTFAGYGVTR